MLIEMMITGTTTPIFIIVIVYEPGSFDIRKIDNNDNKRIMVQNVMVALKNPRIRQSWSQNRAPNLISIVMMYTNVK